MDTVPLLSPTMETELLKEPWVFPQSKLTIKEEKKATPSAWEENFQDLSGWCMDTFQGQCDFRIGESPTFKLSGTKDEGNSALASEEGVLKDLISVAGEDKWSIKMNGSTEHTNNNCHSLQSTSKVTSKCDRRDSTANSNTSNLWLKLSKRTTPTIPSNVNVISWNKQNDADASIPFQARCQIEDINLNNACPTSFGSAENQRETWDVLQTVETTGSESFDLLSYLCDDEVSSPEGSVSIDGSIVSLAKSPTTISLVVYEEMKTENESDVQSRVAPTLILPTTEETSAVSSRRSERKRAAVTSKVEKTYNRIVKRSRPERRRDTETDSSSDQTYGSHYRESREKNNEASRKSRMNKKAKECEMTMKAMELERDNRILKMKVEELEKLVTSMRSALLRSALKKEF
ncbi:uncharacterized protein LOC143343132 isoform X2 [Colletes latitarsis]|uniref:uncharacterized protein LOC143343132 isoform X2 n=1 Tax=Colletes latitarsis TaxID=2605962 RepID=UPI0040364C24